MTRLIESLAEALHDFDVAVLDQWGVMHNGSQAYPGAIAAMEMLATHGKRILVLSNSGKRADLNLARIASMQIPIDAVSGVVTSGEALWQDLHADRVIIDGIVPRRLYPICGKAGDADVWADESEQILIADDIPSADAIMLMGLPDGSRTTDYDAVFSAALESRLPLICSNPDKKSPRDSGLVTSPGALAERYERLGGNVLWYGKPHAEVFHAVTRCAPDVPLDRFLMVGDSMEHDIAGATKAGFKSALIRGGIHAADFQNTSSTETVVEVCQRIATQHEANPPVYSLPLLA